MGGKGISRQARLFSRLHQRRKARAHLRQRVQAGLNTHNIAVLVFKFQQPVNGIIILE